MNNADGATRSRLFNIPRFAEMSANGIMSFTINKAPWEKGSKMGTSRLTLSRLKAERAAILPVLKNADCKSVRKKTEVRASVKVNDL